MPAEARGASVAVGNFDGVHRGHRAVIAEAGQAAHAQGLPWAVLTFEPHPRRLFQPDLPPFRLTPMRAKARLIAELGVDFLIVQRFDRAFAGVSAETFVDNVLVRAIGARHVVSGYDFVFGRGRGGDCALLLKMGAERGFDFTAVRPVADEQGEALSSTRVRACLAAGDAKGAAHVLGRPFEIEGRVRRGAARGRTLGFPTANLALGPYQRPKLGVYAVRVGLETPGGMVWLPGVANLGRRPTFGDRLDEVLEVFLFDFEGDLYGRRLRVRLIDYVRPERRFDGPASLKAQIAADSAKARAILSNS